MTKLRIFQVDSFTEERFSGNPAGVVLGGDGLSDARMQAIARELNNSETAFVLEPDASDHEVRVRFFTPTMEVPSCGHATIAAHFVRAQVLGLPSCTVVQKIGAGVLPVDIVRGDGDRCEVVMTQGAIEISKTFDAQTDLAVSNGLGLTESDRNIRFPMRIASTGHSKVMVGINSREGLNRLRPRMGALVKLSESLGCNGYYVFTLDSDDPAILVHGRMFAPAIGIAEDPVTGNANGPLGAYLVDLGLRRLGLLREDAGAGAGEDEPFEFTARQGEACGRPGTIRVRVMRDGNVPKLVQVAGTAVIVFETELEV